MLNNKIKKNQQVMVPIHIKITEEMHDLLSQVAKHHGFPRIQGLIRLYIRRGLDAEDVGYSLEKDNRFLDKLKRQGVPEAVIFGAIEAAAEAESTAHETTTPATPPTHLE